MFGFEKGEFREKFVVLVTALLFSATCLGIAVAPAHAGSSVAQIQSATVEA